MMTLIISKFLRPLFDKRRNVKLVYIKMRIKASGQEIILAWEYKGRLYLKRKGEHKFKANMAK